MLFFVWSQPCLATITVKVVQCRPLATTFALPTPVVVREHMAYQRSPLLRIAASTPDDVGV